MRFIKNITNRFQNLKEKKEPKQFALVVKYTCGKCVFLTNTNDLQAALKEFQTAVIDSYKDALGDKNFSIPQVISAEIVKLYYQ